jgi:hypothetical protein
MARGLSAIPWRRGDAGLAEAAWRNGPRKELAMKRFGLTMAAALLTVGVSSAAFGQAQPGQPGQPGGDRGGDRGRGNFDPAQMRAQYLLRLKEQLGANDDEWKVLEPKLTKVMDASRASRSSSGFGGGSTRGRGPGGGDSNRSSTPQPDPNASPVSKASAELRAVVERKDAAANEYTEKLNALRAARAKAEAEQAAAEKELKDVLTPKQEAILVANGMIK